MPTIQPRIAASPPNAAVCPVAASCRVCTIYESSLPASPSTLHGLTLCNKRLVKVAIGGLIDRLTSAEPSWSSRRQNLSLRAGSHFACRRALAPPYLEHIRDIRIGTTENDCLTRDQPASSPPERFVQSPLYRKDLFLTYRSIACPVRAAYCRNSTFCRAASVLRSTRPKSWSTK